MDPTEATGDPYAVGPTDICNLDHYDNLACSVLNTFRTMVTDDDILEKEDMYILTRMKEFASNEEVVTFAAAKQLLILIERAVSYELFL